MRVLIFPEVYLGNRVCLEERFLKNLDLNRMGAKLTNGLVHFKEQLPILFECFEPKFSLLTSFTYVVE